MTDQIKTAQKHLEQGGLVAVPTETVYGLAGDARNGKAIANIFKTKGRPQFNPLICHVSHMEMAKLYGKFDMMSERLAEIFWPGPLTLIVPKAEHCPAHDLVTADLTTIGIRMPQGITQRLIKNFGHALAAPSANTSGKISPTSAQHVREDLGDKVHYILDDGPSRVGLESSIVKIEGGTLKILRAGAITKEMIGAALGIPANIIELANGSEPHQKTPIEAPGMMLSHYAPNATLRLNAETVMEDEALLCFGSKTSPQTVECALSVKNLSPSGDLVEAAANLYAYMKALDKTKIAKIAVEPIPNHGLGLAINDRLMRAAAPRDKS